MSNLESDNSEPKSNDDARTASSGVKSRKITRSVSWVLITSVFAKGATLVSSVILARLLDPSEFGLLALATAIITFSQGATQTGFESALIQKQHRPEDFLNTAWTFELLRCLILYGIIFLFAPIVGVFFNEPRADLVLRVAGLVLLLQGLRNIGTVYFRKDFEFHKQFLIEIVPLVLYVPLVIALSFQLKSVWALIFANLASGVLTLILSYVLHAYRPHLSFSVDKAIDLFGFGKWILGNSILVMIREQGTVILTGKLLGMPSLGFINRADAFSTLIFQQVNDIVWKVGYSAYSKLHVYPQEFKNAYLRSLYLVALIQLPMAGGLYVLSADFVSLFLTDKWLPVVPVIKVLCIQAAIISIGTPALVAFQAAGKPAVVTWFSFAGVMILTAIFYPLALQFGIVGVAYALCISISLPSPLLWYSSMKLVNCSFVEWLKPVGVALFSTSVMVITLYFSKAHLSVNTDFVDFFILVGVGVLAYFVVTLVIYKAGRLEILGYIKAMI